MTVAAVLRQYAAAHHDHPRHRTVVSADLTRLADTIDHHQPDHLDDTHLRVTVGLCADGGGHWWPDCVRVHPATTGEVPS